jgi:hypothetical protein
MSRMSVIGWLLIGSAALAYELPFPTPLPPDAINHGWSLHQIERDNKWSGAVYSLLDDKRDLENQVYWLGVMLIVSMVLNVGIVIAFAESNRRRQGKSYAKAPLQSAVVSHHAPAVDDHVHVVMAVRTD